MALNVQVLQSLAMSRLRNEASREIVGLGHLRYSNSDDRIFNAVILDISVLLRKTTLTISVIIETGSPFQSEIVRVASLSTTEIIEKTR